MHDSECFVYSFSCSSFTIMNVNQQLPVNKGNSSMVNAKNCGPDTSFQSWNSCGHMKGLEHFLPPRMCRDCVKCPQAKRSKSSSERQSQKTVTQRCGEWGREGPQGPFQPSCEGAICSLWGSLSSSLSSSLHLNGGVFSPSLLMALGYKREVEPAVAESLDASQSRDQLWP